MNPMKVLRRRLEQLQFLRHHFRDLVHEERGTFAIATLFLVGETIFQVLLPWPIKYITDGLLIPGEGKSLPLIPDDLPALRPWWFLGGVCAALLVTTIIARTCEYHRRIFSATAGQRIVLKLRKRLYSHLHRLPMGFHNRSRLGDLLLRLTGDVPMLRDILSDSVLEIVGRSAYALVVIGFMLWLDSTLTCVALGVLACLLILSAWYTKRVSRAVRKQRRRESALAFAAGESLRAVAQVKAYGREAEVTRRFAKSNRASLRAGLQGTRLQASLTRWAETLFAAGTATVLLVGVYRVVQVGSLTEGDLLLFLAYSQNLNKPLRKLTRMSSRIGKAAACGERVLELLALSPEPLQSKAGDLPALRGGIRLHRLSHAYSPHRPALENLDLDIEPGQRIALVGRNGAGKTTLLNLLLRFYAPRSGRIEFDGVDAASMDLTHLRNQITVVLQESYLFGSTIADNLEFAVPGASHTAMQEALREVGADFVQSLDGGLDAPLQENASNLSGGQRRKVLLAAGLLRGSPILILDEPTSNIDPESRSDLIQRLPRLTAGLTTLVITHDADMLAWVDRVVYLEQGRVQGTGSHDELWRKDPTYRELFPRTPSAQPEESA